MKTSPCGVFKKLEKVLIIKIVTCQWLFVVYTYVAPKSVNHAPHLIQDTTRESDKNTRKHHPHESQEISPFPAGDHTVAI